jgi:predicted aspartyl protease
MTRYRYNQQVKPPAPFVHVMVSPPIEGASGSELPAQIDTAADMSVIPRRLVDELRLVQLDEIPTLGFGGHVLILPTFLVRIEIRQLPPRVIEVLASPDELFCLLGRDILNEFRITLDGPNAMLEIQ